MNKVANKKNDGSGRYDFIKAGRIFTIVSITLVVLSLADIFIADFNYGIDFVGGTEMQIKFTDDVITTQEVREFSAKMGFENANVQKIGGGDDASSESEYLIRFNVPEQKTDEATAAAITEATKKITDSLSTEFPNAKSEIRRVDTVGPQIGSELKNNAVLAMLYSLLLVLIYIGLRFDYKYAPGAIFCLFHDAIVVLGIFAVLRIEVNIQTLAAVLTIIGYSLNDTIVIFDRIRENVPLYRDKSFAWVCNRSINDTLARTLMTSFLTLLAVAALYFIAGGVIEDFAFALGLGIMIGSYSTIFVATPLVILADRLQNAKKAGTGNKVATA